MTTTDGLLSFLLNVRKEVEAGHVLMYTGVPVDIYRFEAVINGFMLCQQYYGIADIKSGNFFDWLMFSRFHQFTRGWSVELLDMCGGDHLMAISKFLELVAEYDLLEKQH